ncbi:MAG TPA: hypothetical protein VGY66_02575 [Gemmataceae bacterium]|jgi:hypothetical protein|nr:hypothetical protein [Gemmataceae bacterium]
MKFVTQMVLVILAIVGVVAGITYVSQFSSTRKTGSGDPSTVSTTNAASLTFPIKIMNYDPPTAGEFEMHAPGHQDFRFVNKNAVPVDLGLMSKSCKCSDIQACVLTAEEGQYLDVDALVEAAAMFSAAERGALGFLGQAIQTRDAVPDMQKVKLNWQKLEPQMGAQAMKEMRPVNFITVPPGGTGFVRFDWDGRKTKEGPDRLVIEVWTQAKSGKAVARDFVKLECPVTFVPPLRISPDKVALDELGPRDERIAEYYCWSATRSSFNISAWPQTPDPCIACEWEPLNEEECTKLSEREKSRVLTGYRIRLRVHERAANGKPLDVGPFARRILVKSDMGEDEAMIGVVGAVLGDFIVGSDEDKGRVILESFPARNGAIKQIIITARQAGVGLQVGDARIEPSNVDYIRATLKEDGTGRWKLLVKVAANCPPGKISLDTAVVLKISGDQEGQQRQLRIPIRGTAYVKQ